MHFLLSHANRFTAAAVSCTKSCVQRKSVLLRVNMTTSSMNPVVTNKSEKFADARDRRLIWVDCEMTGLDLDTHTLVEIACIVTEGDAKLTPLDDGINIVINQSSNVLRNMSDWCQHTFTQNGLLDAIIESPINLAQAEEQVLKYVRQHTNAGKCPLAGNSVSVDRTFINRYMPSFGKHLHYRTVDVSSIKELARRWYPDTNATKPDKNAPHRALDDIVASIDELKWYKQHLFRDDVS